MAADGCDQQVVPRAALALAEALTADGRGEEGAEYLSRAAATADARLSPDVILALGSRCAAMGQVDLAVAVYRDFLREVAVSDSELAAVASYRLADIYRERNELEEAKNLFIRAFRDGSMSLKPHAAVALGDLMLEQDCPYAAEKFYRWVLKADHADLAPKAGYQLAVMHREAGDQVEAVRILRAVALSGHPLYGPMAEEELVPMIEELDVSTTVDGMVDEALGGGQLQFAAEVVRSHCAASRLYAYAHRPVPPHSGVLLVAITLAPSAIPQTPQSPLQLETGDPQHGLRA